jgi:hypothetical protein
MRVSVERPGRCAGTIGIAAAPAVVFIGRPIRFVGVVTSFATVAINFAAPNFGASVFTARTFAATSVEVVPVIKGVAPGVVPVVVMGYIMATPIGVPMMPAPSISSVEADSEAHPK